MFFDFVSPDGTILDHFRAGQFVDMTDVTVELEDGELDNVIAYVPYCRNGCGETINRDGEYVYSNYTQALENLRDEYECIWCGAVYKRSRNNNKA